MIFLDMLGAAERQNNSMLCVGLELELAKFSNKLNGGDAAAIVKASRRPDVPIISNLSRAMIYAFRDEVLVGAARRIALKTRDVLTAARLSNLAESIWTSLELR